MDLVTWIPALVVLSVLGSLAGFLVGLVPGIHQNTLATSLLLVKPAFFSLAAATFGAAMAIPAGTAMLCTFLVAAVVAHGIASFVPSVFLGAPGDASAISVLPGHRLLREGRGHEAVAAAARGARLGAFATAPGVLLLRWLMGPPVDGYERARGVVPLLLAGIVIALILSERARREGASTSPAGQQRIRATSLFVASGALGWAVLGTGLPATWNWFPIPGFEADVGSRLLLPLFTGLFGLGTLLASTRSRRPIPPQRPPEIASTPLRTGAVLTGSVAGAAVSWLPGLSSGAATSLAQLLARRRRHDDDPVEFMAALGVVGIATNIFTVAALFIIQRARSGVAVAVQDLVGPSAVWGDPGTLPALVAIILLAAPVSATLSYPLAIRASRAYARVLARLPYRGIALGVAILLIGFVAIFAGAMGILIAALAVPLGVLPPRWGVKRIHLMGALLLPVMILSV